MGVLSVPGNPEFRGLRMSEDSKVNVLLVDDRPENLLVLSATLASLGENLIEAKSWSRGTQVCAGI